jgi:hypothetical protein
MRTIHPFQWLSPSVRGKFFVVALALTLFLLVSLNAINGPLTTPEAPLGILSFELAGESGSGEISDCIMVKQGSDLCGSESRARLSISLCLSYCPRVRMHPRSEETWKALIPSIQHRSNRSVGNNRGSTPRRARKLCSNPDPRGKCPRMVPPDSSDMRHTQVHCCCFGASIHLDWCHC